MGQTGGLPHYDGPGSGPGYAPRGDADGGYGALARRQPEGGDPAMAILKAFQDYMEHERQRAQRRTTTAVVAFSALLVLVVVGFAAMWMSTMGRMQNSQSDLMRAALAVREERQPASPPVDVAAAIASAVAQTEKSAAERAAAEKAARDSEAERLAEARRQADVKAAGALEERLAAERKKAAAEAAAKEAEVAKALKALNEAVEAARRDNEALRKDNAALRAASGNPAPAAAKPVADTQHSSDNPASPAPTRGKPFFNEPPVAKVGTIAPPITIKRAAPPKGYSHDTLSIPVPVGEGGAGQVNWRLFLPSELPAQ